MDRRAFFKSALNQGSKKVVKAIDSNVNKQASRWIRPPHAIDELSFLLSCTRCNHCIDACPHNIIFSLSAKTGAKVAGTPALDLLNQGCHLCADWPCVTACNDKALLRDTNEANSESIPLPKLAIITIDRQTCLPFSGPECGACIDSCPVPGALTLDFCRPVINQSVCTGCALCRQSCILDDPAIHVKSLHSQAT